MLDKVPVAKILGFLCVATVILLGWITWDGYRTASGAVPAGPHIRFALFGIVVALFTHTMTLFYFVGTGSRIRKVVTEYGLAPELTLRTRRLKSRLFPWLTFTPLLTMAAFILGGGAHTGVIPGWAHGVPALLALVANVMTAVMAIRCLGDNIQLIDEIDALLPQEAGE